MVNRRLDRRLNLRLNSGVQWMRRIAGVGAIAVAGLLFLPAERVPIPADYGGSSDGATIAAAADGPTLFAEHCAACHGLSGEGGRGPTLVARIDVIGRNTARRQITKGSLSMPAFGRTLTRAEIEAVLDHLATMVAPPTSTGRPTGVWPRPLTPPAR